MTFLLQIKILNVIGNLKLEIKLQWQHCMNSKISVSEPVKMEAKMIPKRSLMASQVSLEKTVIYVKTLKRIAP